MASLFPFLLLFVLAFATEKTLASILSTRLIHRFSEESRALITSPSGRNRSASWPENRGLEYYRLLASGDFRRQKLKLGAKYQYLFPSEGSETAGLGNDFGWLHYVWIDIGTPKVSFLVALDVGSDLLWLPCNCVQCAPLSSSYYNSLNKDLNEYDPSSSSTSKFLSCKHQLCESSPDNCLNPMDHCPYTVNYVSENTSSSGLLVEDILHLSSANNDRLNAPVIIGCGKKQSGDYMEGVAPDGLMGLGLGEISAPSYLAKSGLMRNSFSLCFGEDQSGRIYFGDIGPPMQQSTQFLPLNNKFIAYVVGVEAYCIGNSCLKESSFRTIIDTGASFTYLPKALYRRVAGEFDRHINATVSSFQDLPWKHCYKTSIESELPRMKLVFSNNNSFVVHDPIFRLDEQGLVGFCLAIQPIDDDIGTIGHNFMTGYKLAFDRENMKLGWSASKCPELSSDNKMGPTDSTPPYALPTDEQQRGSSQLSGNSGVSPAVAGRTPADPSQALLPVTPSSALLLLVSMFWLAFLSYM